MGESWLPWGMVNSSRVREMYNHITKESRAVAIRKMEEDKY